MEHQTLGKYEIRRELGRGGAGVVYEGWDPDLARTVALKTVRLPPVEDEETTQQLTRFRQEAQAAARLSHPNIVQVYDYGRIGELSFIAMEFIDGGSLKQLVGQPMAPAEAVRLVRQVLAGLAASHALGVVHRDIKPDNIMLRGDQAKIADFGIARITSSQLTQDGTVLGTPSYMSPEQFRGETVDLRTDIWSAGVLLYQLLTGRRPFEGAGFAAVMNKVLNTEPPPPSTLCPPGQMPAALERAVLKALDKRLTPDGRFASAAAFSQALEGVFEETQGDPDADDATQVLRPARRPVAPPPPPPPPPPPVRRQSVLPLAGGAAALVLVAAGLGGWWLMADHTTPITPTGSPSASAPVPPLPPAPVPAPVLLPAPVLPPPEPLPPAPAPVPLPTPAPSTPDLAGLRAMVAGADCTLVSGALEANKLILYGLAASDRLAPIAAAWRTLHDAAAPGGSYQMAIQPFEASPAYCGALDAIRPFANTVGSPRQGVMLQLDSRGKPLREHAPFSLAVTMPDFAGGVQIDYFSGGDVAHLGLRPAGQGTKSAPPTAFRRLGAGERAVIYDGTATDPGTDLVIAIAAREPLFPKPRPETEPAAAYLEALRTALRDRLPATLSAHAIRAVTER